jgi:hypothetical protein
MLLRDDDNPNRINGMGHIACKFTRYLFISTALQELVSGYLELVLINGADP